MRIFQTPRGVRIRRRAERLDPSAVEQVIDRLDSERGLLLCSSYEFPGRYTRSSRGFVNPPIAISCQDRRFEIEALNERGAVLLEMIAPSLGSLSAVDAFERRERVVAGVVRPPSRRFPEEERSRQNTVFSILRDVLDQFRLPNEPYLGLYGSFGYDLVFQFENIERIVPRPPGQRDLVVFLPDELLVVEAGRATRFRYDFELDGLDTAGLPRSGSSRPYVPSPQLAETRDHRPGEFAETVLLAKESFKRGDLFEVVSTQTFFAPCLDAPSALFRRLREANPAPYGALANLGDGEYLVSASPEMYVRVEGRRVESCPISGTIARGADALADAEAIRELLNSRKDESELTMCTDVDRNDKSRICEPGTVRVIGRRQVELYSKLIHTVDHVEGRLAARYDAIDAFLAHMWEVTVTGAPKLWAMRFIEQYERSPRVWYGGAIGWFGLDGNANMGLTLRTVRINDGVAEIRAGGTLLIDSDPQAEERETELKAAAFLEALRPRRRVEERPAATCARSDGTRRILLIDHEDSFVHTLANYFRQAGAEVVTVRAPLPRAELQQHIDERRPHMLVLSPGPGEPSDFRVADTVDVALASNVAVFGVCLGLQGIVEYFGGKLGLLDYPMHGKASEIRVLGGALLRGLPASFRAGRYHSIFAVRDSVPPMLQVTAETDDGVVMAVEHAELPVAAVQFHPESIMTARSDVGLMLVRNVVDRLGDPHVLVADRS